MAWIERYLSGDRERGWHELRQLGDRVRDPAVVAEAQAVCDEMARRARQNIEVIADRLKSLADQQTRGCAARQTSTHRAVEECV